MKLNRASARPLFEQLHEQLRAEILAGKIQPDSKLMTEEDLMEEHGISRGTVSRAFKMLQAERLVVWSKGRGLFTAQADVIAAVARKHA